jgi:putative addiction module component (TIGR02574 family)
MNARATEILDQIRKLPETERRELVRRVESEFAQFNDNLTPEQIAELERRAEEMRQHPERGVPWERVQADLQDRLKSCKV